MPINILPILSNCQPEYCCQHKHGFVLPLHCQLPIGFVPPSATTGTVKARASLLNKIACHNIFKRLAERCQPLQTTLCNCCSPLVEFIVCKLVVANRLLSQGSLEVKYKLSRAQVSGASQGVRRSCRAQMHDRAVNLSSGTAMRWPSCSELRATPRRSHKHPPALKWRPCLPV